MPDSLDKRWRIGFMPYLNSAAFYARLEGDWFDLVELPPRNMAAAMQSGELDAGPLPIAEVLRMRGTIVEGGLGVATDGEARSVLLFSDVPAEQLSKRSVAVTGHTSTSVQLLRILFADHWGASGVELRGPNEPGDAELLIGDAALNRVYDGGERRSRLRLIIRMETVDGFTVCVCTVGRTGRRLETRTRPFRRDAAPFVLIRYVAPTENRRPRVDTRYASRGRNNLHRRLYIRPRRSRVGGDRRVSGQVVLVTRMAPRGHTICDWQLALLENIPDDQRDT